MGNSTSSSNTMSAESHIALNAVIDASIAITQTIDQNVDVEQYVEFDCYFKSDKELEKTCIENTQRVIDNANASENLFKNQAKFEKWKKETVKASEKICNTIRGCRVDSVNANQLVTFSMAATQKANVSTTFETSFDIAVTQRLDTVKRGLDMGVVGDLMNNLSNVGGSSSTKNTAYTKRRSEIAQQVTNGILDVATQLLIAKQTAVIKRPTDMAGVSLFAARAVYMETIQADEQLTNLISKMEQQIILASSVIMESALSGVARYLMFIILIFFMVATGGIFLNMALSTIGQF